MQGRSNTRSGARLEQIRIDSAGVIVTEGPRQRRVMHDRAVQTRPMDRPRRRPEQFQGRTRTSETG